MVRRQAGRDEEVRKQAAFDLVVRVIDDLIKRRGVGNMVAGTAILLNLQRQRPGFDVGEYGFCSFGGLLDEAETRGLLELVSDGAPGGYLIRSLSWHALKHWPDH